MRVWSHVYASFQLRLDNVDTEGFKCLHRVESWLTLVTGATAVACRAIALKPSRASVSVLNLQDKRIKGNQLV